MVIEITGHWAHENDFCKSCGEKVEDKIMYQLGTRLVLFDSPSSVSMTLD